MNQFDFVESLLADDLLEQGAFCHWLNPATGEPLYLPGDAMADGTPNPELAVGAYVRSTSSVAYEEFEKRSTRSNVSLNRKARSEAQRQEIILAQIDKETPQKFAVLVTRFKNTSIGNPGEWVPTEAEKLEIARTPKNKAIVLQTLAFSEDTANYPAAGNADAAD